MMIIQSFFIYRDVKPVSPDGRVRSLYGMLDRPACGRTYLKIGLMPSKKAHYLDPAVRFRWIKRIFGYSAVDRRFFRFYNVIS